MMATIHVLDKQTANQIAAGEVVERPMSVVKELVENSVDAGATEIEIEIAEGGVRYLRVTDNGGGMARDDVQLAFLRHATSKIRRAEDIFSVSSMGFRGEALASIASVSKVTLITRTPNDEIGLQLHVNGGEYGEVEEVGAAVGTTVEVADLFYNTPARKKFLKTERTESGRIYTLIGKLALAHTGVAFRLINNGRSVIETPGNKSLADAFAAVYGKELASDMLPFEKSYEGINIHGLVGKPATLKSSRNWQTFIVNQRVVENAVLAKALTNAYQSLLPKRGYPVVVLVLTLNPEQIDVNVHPQKREIKFVDEQYIFRPIYHAVLGALTDAAAPESIATDIHQLPIGIQRRNEEWQKNIATQTTSSYELQDEKSDIRDNRSVSIKKSPDFFTSISTYPRRDANSYMPETSQEVEDASWRERYDERQKQKETEPLFVVTPEEELPVLPLGQIAKCYIVCQRGEDLYIIDQHAAHERVRYDRLSQATERIPTQQLLVPLMISLDEQDVTLLLEHQKELLGLGFVMEQAGPRVIRFTEVPADVPADEHERMVKETLQALHEYHSPNRAQLRHRMIAYAACRGAIKAGHSLQMRQMRQLITDLFTTEKPFVCPHGRPVIVRFSPQDLAQLFRRT